MCVFISYIHLPNFSLVISHWQTTFAFCGVIQSLQCCWHITFSSLLTQTCNYSILYICLCVYLTNSQSWLMKRASLTKEHFIETFPFVVWEGDKRHWGVMTDTLRTICLNSPSHTWTATLPHHSYPPARSSPGHAASPKGLPAVLFILTKAFVRWAILIWGKATLNKIWSVLLKKNICSTQDQ